MKFWAMDSIGKKAENKDKNSTITTTTDNSKKTMVIEGRMGNFQVHKDSIFIDIGMY